MFTVEERTRRLMTLYSVTTSGGAEELGLGTQRTFTLSESSNGPTWFPLYFLPTLCSAIAIGGFDRIGLLSLVCKSVKAPASCFDAFFGLGSSGKSMNWR